MTIRYVCGMDHYGEATGSSYWAAGGASGWTTDNETILGDGWSAYPAFVGSSSFSNSLRQKGTIGIGTPSWGARSGDTALIANALATEVKDVSGGTLAHSKFSSQSMRLPIPGATATVRIIHFAFSMDALPAEDRAQGFLLDFLDSVGNIRGSLAVTPAGRLQLLNGGALSTNHGAYTAKPTALSISASPVIAAQTWYSVNVKVTTNGSDSNADVEVWLGDISAANKVIDATAAVLTNTGSNNIDILGFLPASLNHVTDGGGADVVDNNIRAVRDIVVCDTSGSYNNDALGQVFVSAQEIRAEDSGGGWSANPREYLTQGILDHVTNRTGLYAFDAAALEIGSGDFTAESHVRFASLPGTGDEFNLVAKWRTDTSQRSYRLVYKDDGTLRFEISTDGTAVTTVKNIPWVPVLDKWYHIAVSRWTDTSGSYTSLFIDGMEYGVPVADTNTYYDSSAILSIGALFVGGFTTLVDTSVFDGWLDETRVTVGVGRYTTDFTPPSAAYGRNVSADSDFASVQLLLGYEGGTIVDESTTARTITVDATDPVTAISPNDDDFKYSVLNQRPAWDDTFIEAANLFASGIFTLTAVPTATETITIGATTYTWVSAFDTVATNQVMIGGSIAASLSNLIAAITAGSGAGTAYGTGTTANASATASAGPDQQIYLTALTIGAAGNSVATTETMAAGAFKEATLTGGQDIPADSDFAIERLPIDVTGVLGVQFTARSYKTDAGTAQLSLDLKGPGGTVDTGTAQNVDLNPSWLRQIFEEDPDTSAAMTPSTLIGGRVRFARSA